MTKKELRNKFFKEHTYKCENGIPRVVTHPHDLFEWMYEQLNLTDFVVPKSTLCECMGNERVALDCTMKPCKHPKYFKG
jgi:hypothetical protein